MDSPTSATAADFSVAVAVGAAVEALARVAGAILVVAALRAIGRWFLPIKIPKNPVKAA